MTASDAIAHSASAGSAQRPFHEVDFVVVDVETTGWLPEASRITEIGAVWVRGGRVGGQFSSLVNPGDPIPAQIALLTGIDDEMVSMAPSLRQVLPAFLDFVRGRVLTAHNAPFDVAFLMAACRACDLPWPTVDVVDTADLARRLLPVEEVPDCKLSTLAAHFGTGARPRHRALADALATADVLAGLLARLAGAGVSTLAGISSLPEIRGERSQPDESSGDGSRPAQG